MHSKRPKIRCKTGMLMSEGKSLRCCGETRLGSECLTEYNCLNPSHIKTVIGREILSAQEFIKNNPKKKDVPLYTISLQRS